MDKIKLRRHVKAALDKLTDQQYNEFSKIISEKLLKEDDIKQAKTIAITLSNKPEVDTYSLIENLWLCNKRVVVPKCDPKDRSMQFYELKHFDQLETVYMNLREPIPEKTYPVFLNEIDVVIVPGVVYDLKGYRIGFGGGYYDRFLVNYPGNLISLAFDNQIIDEVPRESHDIPVNIILTEKRKIDCTKNRKESVE